jgi:cell division protein FtsI/penicillin-binding protein 2
MRFKASNENTRALITGVAVSILAVLTIRVIAAGLAPQSPEARGLTKTRLAQAIADRVKMANFPERVEIPIELGPKGMQPEKPGATTVPVQVRYAFDPELQETMEGLFHSYKPDYGAFVAMDAATGRILSMVSYTQDDAEQGENLALRSTFPSASVFKVVTAAAAIETNRLSADSVIAFNGRNHTLYKSNVMSVKETKWTRYMTLKEAFARSVNTVFGRIGAFTVGPQELRQYASRFGFNREVAGDLPVQPSKATIPDDPWGLAESASGFTRDNTMSPLQGALIAASIANDGVMMEPFVIDSVATLGGETLYLAQPKVVNPVVDPATAAEIRKLMQVTVHSGTASHSFRGFFRRELAELDVGGKTGSLTGDDPKGRDDWFIGFADDGHRKIAIAALTVHKKLWRVKSSYLARRAIETLYRDPAQVGASRQAHHKSSSSKYPVNYQPLVLSPELLAAGARSGV